MKNKKTEPAQRTEMAISAVLRTGVNASLVLLMAGTALAFARGGYGHGADEVTRLTGSHGTFPRTLAWLAHGIAHLDGQAVIVSGLLLLIATPVIRVAVSVWAYAKERDTAYVIITTVVLALLLLSFALGKAG